MAVPYKLSAELYGHTNDVRCVTALNDTDIASSSKDCTLRVWKSQPETAGYAKGRVLHGHEQTRDKGGIYCVYYIKPGTHPHLTAGAILSGGFDKLICLWDLENNSNSPSLTLIGHQGAVTCFTTTLEGDIVSGSTDNTIRIWRGTQCIKVLDGHKFPVWSVITLSNGDLVSASGDTTIKIWRGGNCVKTITGHQEAVRGLAHVPGLGFLSCSNDAMIKFWSYDGEQQAVLVGHTNFIFSVAVAPNGEFLSASEDGTVKVWSNLECIQTLKHPAGIWSVAALENGDVVTGCQDSIVRVWTRDPMRQASDEMVAEYEKRVSSIVGDLDVSILPTVESLASNPGKTHGETKMVRSKTGSPQLYTWSTTENKWEFSGDITNAIETKRATGHAGGPKQRIGNKEYDFVFKVDLEDGFPPRDLGYNVGENPYTAAQEFIHKNDLNQDFLDQIAKFIIANSSTATIGAAPTGPSIDPFTSNRYVPQSGASGPNTTTTTTTSAATGVVSQYFPQKYPVLLDTGNFANILSKVKQVNAELEANPDKKEQALSAQELAGFELAVNTLKETSRYHATSFGKPEIAAVKTALKKLPVDVRFPVLDLLRLGLIHSDFASKVADLLLDVANEIKADAPAPNQIMALRFVANAAKPEVLKQALLANAETILEKIADVASSMNKNVRQGAVTALLNFTVLFQTQTGANDAKLQVISIFTEALANEDDFENLLRGLTALGTLVASDSVSRANAVEMGLKDIVQKHAASANANVAQAAKDIITVLSK